MRILGAIVILSLFVGGGYFYLQAISEQDPTPQTVPVTDDAAGATGETEADAATQAAMAEEDMAEADYDPPTPHTFTLHEEEIVDLVTNAPWVSAGREGPALYMIAFRSCPTCLAFKAAEQEHLASAGVDIRYIVYARRDRDGRERSSTEERAVQAELWLTRDWDLFQDWYAIDPDTYYVTSHIPPTAEEDPERAAAVEEARALVDRLAELYADNDIDLAIPTLLWQQDGVWTTYVGYDPETFAPIRAYFKTVED